MQVIQYTEGMVIPESGFVDGMPNDVYQAIDTHVSNSRMKLMQLSAFKYFNPAKYTETRPKQVGSAIHAKILEPELFDRDYITLPEIKNRQQPEYKSAVKALGDGKVFVGEECKNIDRMYQAAYGNDDIADLLKSDGYCELSGFATCPETGLKLRVRFDKLLTNGKALDIKKTQSVLDRDLSNTIFNYGYHIQEAFYSYVYRLITGEELESFNFAFIEEKEPSEAQLVRLDDISKMIANDEMKVLLSQVKHYTEIKGTVKNNNPMTYVSLPEWLMRQYENSLEIGE